jgi:methylmalonyl-CoA mutase C-terminal domain/subunit
MTMASPARVVMAKTSLDGHWRGVAVVARALRDAGFEVVMLGAASADEIVEVALQEDVDVVGLNVGGRVEVVERILDRLADAAPDVPVMAGGTIAPWARQRLEARGVAVFPPGSPLTAIVSTATRLCTRRRAAPSSHRGG